jgi:hypothetical protein
LTLNGATTASATVTSTTQLQIGSVIATYGDSQITFGSTGTFANQTWTKLDLPANYTNSRGAATHITQNGASLMFVDSVGGTSPGQWISPTQVFATAWNESATTDIGRLLWQDGSIWSENLVLQGTKNGAGTTTITASPSQFTVVDYTNGSGKPVHLIKTGTTHVVFVDSLGRMSLGSFFNPTQALADLYPGDVATFSGGGVLWKDGTVWIQAASLSPQITLTDYTNANGVATHLIRNGTANLAIGDSLGRLSLGTFFNATQALTNLYPHDVATITPNTITWQDGTVWTVTGSSPITTTATDANGVLSHLKLLTPTMLIGLDGPLQGVHGTRLNGKLFWANGAVWDNLDLSALNAFFEMGTGYP